MKKYNSEALKVLHEMMNGIHNAGGISEERMRFYDEGCLAKSAPARESVSSKKSAGAGYSSVPIYAHGK